MKNYWDQGVMRKRDSKWQFMGGRKLSGGTERKNVSV